MHRETLLKIKTPHLCSYYNFAQRLRYSYICHRAVTTIDMQALSLRRSGSAKGPLQQIFYWHKLLFYVRFSVFVLLCKYDFLLILACLVMDVPLDILWLGWCGWCGSIATYRLLLWIQGCDRNYCFPVDRKKCFFIFIYTDILTIEMLNIVNIIITVSFFSKNNTTGNK